MTYPADHQKLSTVHPDASCRQLALGVWAWAVSDPPWHCAARSMAESWNMSNDGGIL
jgi:hypothetical protein